MSLRERAAFWLTTGVMAWLVVLWVDAVHALSHGGGSGLRLAAPLLGLAWGLVSGLVLWSGSLVVPLLQTGMERACERLGFTLPRHAALVVLAVPPATYALLPAHAVFSAHPATLALFAVYLPFPLAVAVLWIGALWERSAARWPVVGCCAAAVLALHFVNAWYYPGLYPPVHHALTGVALGVAVIGVAFLLRDTVRRAHAAAIAVAVAPGLLGSGPSAARSDAHFDGTELQHVMVWTDALLDRDGDGVAGWPGVDCDDGDPRVSPLRVELPGNGIDDNCRLGDRKATVAAPAPAAIPPPAGLAAWRSTRPRWNLLLILIDTLRADVVGALGSRRGLTPNLDALAARSALFTQARTTHPRTGPALVSLARARYHGRNLVCRRDLHGGAPTLGTRLAERGYRVAARLVGDRWLGTPGAMGWGRVTQRDTFQMRSDAAVTRDARQLIRGDQPFALLVHYADPHSPYLSHPGIAPRGAGIAAAYGAEVEATDRELGALLAALAEQGRADDTVVVVLSDHGENLGERGSRGGHHGVSVYDEDVRVPLVVHLPGREATRIDAPVSIADVAPTLLELLGAAPLPDADGRSLAGPIFGAAPQAGRWTLSEYYDPDYQLRAIVSGHHKLIQDVGSGVARLYDVRRDPGELRDLARAEPERRAELSGLLDTWIEHRADPTEPHPERCP